MKARVGRLKKKTRLVMSNQSAGPVFMEMLNKVLFKREGFLLWRFVAALPLALCSHPVKMLAKSKLDETYVSFRSEGIRINSIEFAAEVHEMYARR